MVIRTCIQESFPSKITSVKYLPSLIVGFMLLGIWSCSDIGAPCSEGLDCFGNCGGSAIVDDCGVCGGPGYNAGGCCGADTNCISYTDIQLIFDETYGHIACTACHGNSGSLDLTSYAKLMAGGLHGNVVNPLDSENSTLIIKLNSTTPPFGSQMPDGGSALNASIIAQIATWIDQGAIETPIPTPAN